MNDGKLLKLLSRQKKNNQDVLYLLRHSEKRSHHIAVGFVYECYSFSNLSRCGVFFWDVFLVVIWSNNRRCRVSSSQSGWCPLLCLVNINNNMNAGVSTCRTADVFLSSHHSVWSSKIPQSKPPLWVTTTMLIIYGRFLILEPWTLNNIVEVGKIGSTWVLVSYGYYFDM